MKKAVCFLILIALLFGTTAFADDTILGGEGSSVYPVNETDVVMEKEIIDIQAMGDVAYVRCQFFFHNTGKYTRLLMGFPGFDESMKPDNYDPGLDDPYLHAFHSWVDGKSVPVRFKKGMKDTGYNSGDDYYPNWYTWNVWFRAGERKKVTNTYWFSTLGDSSGTRYIDYILKTGANWKGTIGKVTVRMNIEDFDPYDAGEYYWAGEEDDLLPPDYIDSDGTLIWERENWEPDKDISICLTGDDSNNDFKYDEYPSSAELERLFNAFDSKHYNGVTWWANRIIRHYGNDQPDDMYYDLGISYMKKHRYQKALDAFEKIGEYGSFYKALVLKKMGKLDEYKALLQSMASSQEYPCAVLWAKSRLMDLDKK